MSENEDAIKMYGKDVIALRDKYIVGLLPSKEDKLPPSINKLVVALVTGE